MKKPYWLLILYIHQFIYLKRLFSRENVLIPEDLNIDIMIPGLYRFYKKGVSYIACTCTLYKQNINKLLAKEENKMCYK